jgi:hypothetical protein
VADAQGRLRGDRPGQGGRGLERLACLCDLDFSAGLVLSGSGDALVAAGIAYLLAPVIAWITTLGRGYLPPLGFALAMLALGNVFAKTGWADWFPWSIVPLSIGMVGQPVQTLPAGSCSMQSLPPRVVVSRSVVSSCWLVWGSDQLLGGWFCGSDQDRVAALWLGGGVAW